MPDLCRFTAVFLPIYRQFTDRAELPQRKSILIIKIGTLGATVQPDRRVVAKSVVK